MEKTSNQNMLKYLVSDNKDMRKEIRNIRDICICQLIDIDSSELINDIEFSIESIKNNIIKIENLKCNIVDNKEHISVMKIKAKV